MNFTASTLLFRHILGRTVISCNFDFNETTIIEDKTAFGRHLNWGPIFKVLLTYNNISNLKEKPNEI